MQQLKTGNDLWTLKSKLFSKVNKSGYAEQEGEMAEEMRRLEESKDETALTVENKFLKHYCILLNISNYGQFHYPVPYNIYNNRNLHFLYGNQDNNNS